MKIRFLGAAQTVTGSKYELSCRQERILIDCGLFQGLKDLRLKNWEAFPVDVTKIQAVIVSHAHLDHSGYIPLLVKSGFRGKIYATPPTRELCRLLLLDSAYLQEEEAKFANKHGYSKHRPALPLYTREDAERSLARFVDIGFHSRTQISNEFSFEFIPAGHLLGAASVRVFVDQRSLVFSGDLGRQNDPIMKPPEIPQGGDALIVESTYGDRLHSPNNAAADLKRIINTTISRGGTVLIPSFAAGRAQLLLYHLRELKRNKEIPDVPVYLNSPMANSVNIIFRKYTDYHKLSREEAVAICQTAAVVSTPEESRNLCEDNEPKIILAASGMATGGRVLHHLKTLAPESKNAIVFAGFQAAGTRGEALVHGKREIKIHGSIWPVRAEVFNLDSLSAHADAGQILDWLAKVRPQSNRIFVTHGEPSAVRALAANIGEKLGIEAETPTLMSSAEI